MFCRKSLSNVGSLEVPTIEFQFYILFFSLAIILIRVRQVMSLPAWRESLCGEKSSRYLGLGAMVLLIYLMHALNSSNLRSVADSERLDAYYGKYYEVPRSLCAHTV